MSKIDIPFCNEMKELLYTNKKLATTRNKRYGGVGDTFDVVFKGTILTYEILAVFCLSLYDVAKELYFIEGFLSSMEFRECWVRLHSRIGWTPDKPVFVHIFRRIVK